MASAEFPVLSIVNSARVPSEPSQARVDVFCGVRAGARERRERGGLRGRERMGWRVVYDVDGGRGGST